MGAYRAANPGVATDPALIALMTQLVKNDARRTEIELMKWNKTETSNFRIPETSLPEIRAEDPRECLANIEKFEKAHNEAKIKAYRTWVTNLRAKLKGMGSQWVESGLICEPGLTLYTKAKSSDNNDDWGRVYEHCRNGILFSANLDYPKMRDMYKKRWKAVMMTDKNTYEAVTQSLAAVMEAHMEMTKGQVYDMNDPKDKEEFMKDLDEKFPKSCDIWKLFDSFRTNARFQGVAFKIRSFDQWCHMIMVAIEKWPRAVVDKARVATDGTGSKTSSSDVVNIVDSEGLVLTP